MARLAVWEVEPIEAVAETDGARPRTPPPSAKTDGARPRQSEVALAQLTADFEASSFSVSSSLRDRIANGAAETLEAEAKLLQLKLEAKYEEATETKTRLTCAEVMVQPVETQTRLAGTEQTSPRRCSRARSHCRFLPPLILFIIYSPTYYSVPLFLNRQCDRTLGASRVATRSTSRRPRKTLCIMRSRMRH